MSFVTNPVQQMALNDSTYHLTARERKALDKSWANTFAEDLFPMIDEEPFRVLYCEDNGSPNTPVNIIIGACIIKELLDLSDDEIVEGLMLDIRLQYALHTTSFDEQPLSDKSLTRFRKRCYNYYNKTGVDLIHNCIVSLAGEIAKVMKITGRTRRMDSMMIDSNIKKLSRLELIYTCISNLVKRISKEGGLEIPETLKHYAVPNDFNQVFYYAKSSSYAEKCLTLLNDADVLFELCQENCGEWEEYILFKRCMTEQTVVNDGSRRLATREDRTMNSSMLQNPSDPEATFRCKAGEEHRGYVANFEESVGKNGSIVTDYQFEQNTYSDSQFLHDSLEKMDVQEETVIVSTDGAYPTKKNQKLAESKNVQIVSTNMTGRKVKDICADFVLNKERNAVIQCPAGIDAISCSGPYKNGQMRATFPAACCNNCPYKDQCPSKIGKKVSSVVISSSTISRAQNQRHMQGEESKNFAKFRNGVETIPSILRRIYHADNLPRGKTHGSLFFGFKIGALNFKKLFTYRTGSGKYASNPVIA
jgi:hypothetical protein